MLLSCFLIVFLTLPPNPVSCSSREGALIKSLLCKYNLLTRPGLDSSPVVVKVGITLFQIISVDEKRQIMSTNIQLRLSWEDGALVWNGSDYNDISTVRIPLNLLWSPDIILLNMADEEIFESNHNRARLNAIINNGTVSFVSPMIVRTLCKLDVTWFPFDSQRCPIKFGSWGYTSAQIAFELFSGELDGMDTIDLGEYLPNGEWKLVNVSAEIRRKLYVGYDGAYLTIYFVLELKRQSMYYFFNLIVPSALIGFLALLGFTLPPHSGEKLTLGVTVLFSLIVFLNMIAQSMPANSDGVPLLGTYFNCVMFMIACSVVSTIVVNVNLRGAREPKEIGRIWDKVCLHRLPGLLGIKRDADEDWVELENGGKDSGLQVKSGNWKVEDREILLTRKWMVVAVVVDRLCLILSMLFIVVSTVTFLVSNYF